MSFRFALSGILLGVFIACAGDDSNVLSVNVAGYHLDVEVAQGAAKRAKGLMHRHFLPDDRGMLFVFDREEKPSFWMKNTALPLSIAFIAADGTIRQIEDMEPYSLAMVQSKRTVLYALEVNQGWFAKRGISEGDTVEIPAEIKR